jgi:geranylgeranyl pyrophosphate synthase
LIGEASEEPPCEADPSPVALPVALAEQEDRLDRAISLRLASVTPVSLQRAVEESTRGGKRLRPRMALWFGDCWGVEKGAAEGVACLTEWLHSSFLIQDDIQDGDEWRRDQPTLWKSQGVATALNAADWLLSSVYLEVGQISVPDAIRSKLLTAVQDVHRRTVIGQQLDLDARADPDFSLERYEQAVQWKTGRYLALGMVAIAILAKFHDTSMDLLWKVGDQLGPAFQIQDDLLDMTRSKGRGGQIGNDIREGKPSILFAHALERGDLSPSDRSSLIEVMGKPRHQTSDEDVEQVIEMCRTCGAIDFAREQARCRAEGAVQLFRQIPEITPDVQASFDQLARFAVERNR